MATSTDNRENSTFECSCGNRDKIIESIRLLPRSRGLPAQPHADDFWFEVGTRRVSLRPIFGRTQHVQRHGNEFFLASFNLS